ncbi:alpha/beta hydrolase family protein [Streptomyces jumonjinensis]|uniref:alpha/beta hydrolase family protein n=1 Tax=Streptomyces jumonjinensis TaxID=1945 RepID=UPI002B1EE626|nr:alpha/beta hydrolase [Streptomyces jumonjinensis]
MPARRSLLLGAGGAALAAVLPQNPAYAAPSAPPPSDGVPVPLPPPTGPHPVATRSLHLVDRTRTDPFAPLPGARELMVQLWFPAARPAAAFAEYAPARTAAVLESEWTVRPGSLARVRTGVRTARRTPARPTLILLSHGRGSTGFLTTSLAIELASHGHLVASVDHTHDAAAVLFPDGRLIRGDLPAAPDDWDAQDRLETGVRAADLRFVADQLTARRPAPPRIGVLGHSMGGPAAAEAMRQDRRFAAGLDLDGGLFGTAAADTGLDRPFLLLTSSPDHESWARWRAAHHGWGRHLHLAGGGHLSATDLAGYAEAIGVREAWSAQAWHEALGTLAPERATGIVRAYTVAFFGRFLAHRPAPLLRAPSARFPEVEFRWSRSN